MRLSSSVVAFSLALAPAVWAAPVHERSALVIQQDHSNFDTAIEVDELDTQPRMYPVYGPERTSYFPGAANAHRTSRERLWILYKQVLGKYFASRVSETGVPIPDTTFDDTNEAGSSRYELTDSVSGYTLIVGQGYDDDTVDDVLWEHAHYEVGELESNPDDFVILEEFAPAPVEAAAKSTQQKGAALHRPADGARVPPLSRPSRGKSHKHKHGAHARCSAFARIKHSLQTLRPLEATFAVFVFGVGGGVLLHILCSLFAALINFVSTFRNNPREEASCWSEKSGQIRLDETETNEKDASVAEEAMHPGCSCVLGDPCL